MRLIHDESQFYTPGLNRGGKGLESHLPDEPSTDQFRMGIYATFVTMYLLGLQELYPYCTFVLTSSYTTRWSPLI